MKSIKAITYFKVMLLFSITLNYGLKLSGEEISVPFTFENKSVNKALIKLYEDNPTIWTGRQLYIIGTCYVLNNDLVKAKNIFQSMYNSDPSDGRNCRVLGNVCHALGDTNKAERLFMEGWQKGDVLSLKQYAAIKLQEQDTNALHKCLNDIINNQQIHVDMQKILLSYILIIDDKDEMRNVYKMVAPKLSKANIEKDENLRHLLILATARCKGDEPWSDNVDVKTTIKSNIDVGSNILTITK